MKVLELFSGTASFSKVAKERGHETFTIDNDVQHNPDMVADILALTPEMILERFGKPDVIWASPPCTTFSVASIYRYWDNGKPKNWKAERGIEIVKKTIELIKASYSILDLTTGQMGFGNTVSMFDVGNYNADNMEKFIEHLQKSIDMAIQSKTGQRVQTRVLFWR